MQQPEDGFGTAEVLPGVRAPDGRADHPVRLDGQVQQARRDDLPVRPDHRAATNLPAMDVSTQTGQRWPYSLPQERPRAVVKADLLPAVSVLSLFGLLGIPLGWLWAQLAPAQRSQVQLDGKPLAIDIEAWHRFDALVIFLLLALATGVIIGAGTWLLRERRGPVAMIAAVLGALMAGWLGEMMGGAFLGDRYAPNGPPAVGQIVDQAPEITTSWVLIAAPLATALTYGLLAAWNGRDDLGRRLG